ncbi:TetR/AcrR family transcriptional regulator [Actinoplanes sp. NPDC004185]
MQAAIEILDAGGEDALTFRLLAGRLGTGFGAMYHYVANKEALLDATTVEVITDALDEDRLPDEPRAAIRGLALNVFDAIAAHPWVGTQLVRQPWQFAVVRLFEAIGSRLDALGVQEHQQFHAASAFVTFVLGSAGQSAAAARLLPPDLERAPFLRAVAAQWEGLDGKAFPFARRMADGLEEHDDREQFLAGVNALLAGIGPTSTR